jgi:hypothetical protein
VSQPLNQLSNNDLHLLWHLTLLSSPNFTLLPLSQSQQRQPTGNLAPHLRQQRSAFAFCWFGGEEGEEAVESAPVSEEGGWRGDTEHGGEEGEVRGDLEKGRTVSSGTKVSKEEWEEEAYQSRVVCCREDFLASGEEVLERRILPANELSSALRIRVKRKAYAPAVKPCQHLDRSIPLFTRTPQRFEPDLLKPLARLRLQPRQIERLSDRDGEPEEEDVAEFPGGGGEGA